MSHGTGTHLLTATERYLVDIIQGLRFGAVQVVVHDSRIVQVEVSERFRFDAGERPASRGAAPAPPPRAGPR